ncbi:MAG: reverse transcriptase domain-containing protein, partial [Anaerolineae bacterium]
FREGRRCADAVAQCFNALAKPNSATWILEGDIRGCFDNISFQWMLDHIPLDREVLRKWLRAGYVENGINYPTRKGTPQGGIISPTLANMALDGMEQAVIRAVPRRSRVNLIRYADDFIVTGKSKRILETIVKPAIEEFLAKRGLTLSEEKTAITHIRDGFTFLGQSLRKHQKTLHITPAKEGVQLLVRKVGILTRKYKSAPIVVLIKKLNEVLRGWANYHRHVVASRAFGYFDTYVFGQLWRMLRRRHSNKSKGWLIKRYWTASGRKWVFSIRKKSKSKLRLYQVVKVSSIGIKRNVKIKAHANPYLQQYAAYFWRRRSVKGATWAVTWG